MVMVAAALPAFIVGHGFAAWPSFVPVAVGALAWSLLAAGEDNVQPQAPRTIAAEDTRWRVFAERLYWLLLPVCGLDASFAGPALAAGGALMAVGAGLRLWSLATLGPLFTRTTGVIEGHTLISSGPYRYFKHPNYAGSIILALGMAVAAQSRWGGVACVILVPAVFMAAKHEERYLSKTLPNY